MTTINNVKAKDYDAYRRREINENQDNLICSGCDKCIKKTEVFAKGFWEIYPSSNTKRETLNGCFFSHADCLQDAEKNSKKSLYQS